jgi:glycosyltransferase involved in cell wall biosynthesis
MMQYGAAVTELHIFVFTRVTESSVRLSQNTYAYPVYVGFNPIGFLRAFRKAVKVLKSGTGDWVLTSQDAFTHIFALFLQKKCGTALEVQIHTDFLSPYFRSESIKNYIRYYLYRYAVRRADTIRVVSPRIADSVQRDLGVISDRITILPIFVDIKNSVNTPSINVHKKYPQYDFIVLMASRLTREKNIGLAIGAFRRVAEYYPKALLLIVGSGPEKDNLESHIKRFELNQNVIIEPAVPSETLAAYYATADLFLLTSNYEGYGRTLVEATAAKLPVITTDVGIARDLFVHGATGYIVPVGSRDDLEKGLLWAIGDYPRFKAFGEKAGAMLLDKPPSEEA